MNVKKLKTIYPCMKDVTVHNIYLKNDLYSALLIELRSIDRN